MCDHFEAARSCCIPNVIDRRRCSFLISPGCWRISTVQGANFGHRFNNEKDERTPRTIETGQQKVPLKVATIDMSLLQLIKNVFPGTIALSG